MSKVAYFDQSTILPANWEVWMTLIARYHLYEIFSFAEWSKIIHNLSNLRINSPFDLANFPKTEISALESTQLEPGNIGLLWQAARCFQEEHPSKKTCLKEVRSREIEKIITPLSVNTVGESVFASELSDFGTKLGIPPKFPERTHKAKMEYLALLDCNPEDTESYLRVAARVNLLRSAGSSLRFVCPGINSYASFFSLVNRPIMPPTCETVLLWSAVFSPGRTFKNYLNHLKKACILVEGSLDWLIPSGLSAAQGLKSARRGK